MKVRLKICALDKDLVEARDLLQHLMNDPNSADEVISSEHCKAD